MDHTYSRFDTDLISLRSEIATMAGLVERQFLRAVDATRAGDLGLVSRVLADEDEVNQRHLRTDLHCNTMIARLQPIAIDLREIIAVLHMNNDLERIGDEAKKIAIRARELHARTLPEAELEQLHRMAVDVADMLRGAVDAFARRDAALAAAVAIRDRQVDEARDRLISALVDGIGRHDNLAVVGVDLAFIVQSIERVGDHAKNIAEYVIRIVEGVDPRHRAAVA